MVDVVLSDKFVHRFDVAAVDLLVEAADECLVFFGCSHRWPPLAGAAVRADSARYHAERGPTGPSVGTSFSRKAQALIRLRLHGVP